MNFWDLDGITRLDRVAEIVARRTSDKERWANPENADGALDQSRSRFVGRFIPPGSSVLDIGCGAMGLRNYLPDDCVYTPADIVSRAENCQVVDLNTGEFPHGNYDCIVFLGVLEYIFDVTDVLRKAKLAGKRLYVDYTSQFLPNVQQRRRCGWVSDLSPGDFINAAIVAGWKNFTAIKVINDRYFYICDANLVT